MLSTVFEKDAIESYFSNPFVAKGDKLAALQSVAGEAGLSETTLNLFGVMAENNRMNLSAKLLKFMPASSKPMLVPFHALL